MAILKKLLLCGAKSFPKYNLEEGYIWVHVGIEETMRFKLDANYLNHPLFEELLHISKEEIGYSYNGALRISCEIDLFLHLLHLLKSSNPSVHYMQLQNVIENLHSKKSLKYFCNRQQQVTVG